MESQTWCVWLEDGAGNAFPGTTRKPLSCCPCERRLDRFGSRPEPRWRQWSQFKGLCLPSKLHLTPPCLSSQCVPPKANPSVSFLLPIPSPNKLMHSTLFTLDSIIFSFCSSSSPSHYIDRAWPTWDFICSSVFPNTPLPSSISSRLSTPMMWSTLVHINSYHF